MNKKILILILILILLSSGLSYAQASRKLSSVVTTTTTAGTDYYYLFTGVANKKIALSNFRAYFDTAYVRIYTNQSISGKKIFGITSLIDVQGAIKVTGRDTAKADYVYSKNGHLWWRKNDLTAVSLDSGGVSGGTINELTYWTSPTTLGTLAVATYPSLTELSYVKGLSSAIQTQLNTKLAKSDSIAITGYATQYDILNKITLSSLSSIATGLTYTNTTGIFSLTSGYIIPTTTEQTNWNTAYTNRITSLTTTGSSGASTLISNTLNIPNYTLAGLGGVSGSGTINELAYWTGANSLGTLAVITYPSLTEISYVKGVTSAIQTQINAKIGLSSLSGTSPITYNNATGAIGLDQTANYSWTGIHTYSGSGALKTANAGTPGYSGWSISTAGIFGYDAVLGTTFSLPTNGSAPTFSSGIINSVTFNLYNASVIRTSTTVGNGGALSNGILMNDTGIAGYPANSSTPNFTLSTTTGSMTAVNATLTGTVNATSGKFGTATNYWSVGATGLTATSASTDVIINYGKTDFAQDTTAGFILGYDYSALKSKFEIGSGATKLFKFDGTDLSLTGGTITSGLFKTKPSGQRIEIGESYFNEIQFYDASALKDAITSAALAGSNFQILGRDGITLTTTDGDISLTPGGVNGNIFIVPPSGRYLQIITDKFALDANGNITKLNNITYSFPGVAPALNQVLTCTNATGGVLGWSTPVSGSGTINELVYWTGASSLGTLAVATYPSLTEISYVKGVTSAIQTQLNSKQATITGGATTITTSNLTASKILVSDVSGKVAVSTIASSELFTPAYGELYDNISTSTILTNGTSYVKWTGSTVGEYKGVTGSIANDNLTIDSGQGGKYKISYSVTFSANAIDNYYWTVNISGAGIGKTRQVVQTASTATLYTVSGSGIISLNATDTIDLGCFSTNGRTVTVTYANLNVVKISN